MRDPLDPVPPSQTGSSQKDSEDDRSEEETPEPPKREKVKIKLADGKVRTIQHMMQTTFWSPDGKPMSAQQFVERLFGQLPALFKNEDELRLLWSKPETRKALLEGLAEKGFAETELDQVRLLIDAEKSDLYDVLSYIAYATSPITRQERVEGSKNLIFTHYAPNQQVFLEFVLAEYVKEGVGELDQEKLPALLELKYSGVREAVQELGKVAMIRGVFLNFQQHLYEKKSTG